MATDNTIEVLLSECGYSDRESKVLNYLLGTGNATASLIAKRTQLKRPTVYAVLEGLISEGFVQRQKQDKVTTFAAAKRDLIPELLEGRARTEYQRVRDATKVMAEHLARLPELSRRQIGTYDITTLESAEAVYVELKAALTAGNYCAIFNPQIVCRGEGKSVIAQFLNETGITKPSIREIAVAGPLADWYCRTIRNDNHVVKKLPSVALIETDMIFVDGRVILCNYGSQDENAVMIKQDLYYHSMITIFETLWGYL